MTQSDRTTERILRALGVKQIPALLASERLKRPRPLQPALDTAFCPLVVKAPPRRPIFRGRCQTRARILAARLESRSRYVTSQEPTSAVDRIPAAQAGDAAVLILNHNGRDVLPTCLQTALQLHGLSSPAAVVVADNGSTDDSAEEARRSFPGITVLRWSGNLGFAAGNNRALHALEHEFVLLANSDTALAPDVLTRLAACLGDDVACAGARLVDWAGRRLDFDGGGMSLTGHGHALGIGQPAPAWEAAPRPTLFASGAAMLVHRPTFLRLGGFDADYFCYYEDVDFGWRLWLSGYRVLHVPTAVVRHRHGATARPLLRDQARLLYGRNALATVTKNYGSELLGRLLPAALALAAVRAGAPLAVIGEAGERVADRATSGRQAAGTGHLAAPGQLGLPLPDANWSGWSYLAPLEVDWPSLARRRMAVQALRKRSDGPILPLFAQPYAPVPPNRNGWRALALAVRTFGLDSCFGPPPLRLRLLAWLDRTPHRGDGPR